MICLMWHHEWGVSFVAPTYHSRYVPQFGRTQYLVEKEYEYNSFEEQVQVRALLSPSLFSSPAHCPGSPAAAGP